MTKQTENLPPADLSPDQGGGSRNPAQWRQAQTWDQLDPEIRAVIETFSARMDLMWRRAVLTLGLTTILAVYRRAIAVTARQHPALKELEIDKNGLEQGVLTRFYRDQAENQMTPEQFEAALAEISDWVHKLLAEMISARAVAHLFLKD